MSTRDAAAFQAPTGSDGTSTLLKQYGCGPVQFTGGDNALYERHLLFDNVIDYEINRRLLDAVRTRFPGDEGRVARVSLIEDGPTRPTAAPPMPT